MKKAKILVRKVWLKVSTNQKIVTIPNDSDIKAGDYVLIEKIKVKKGVKI